MNQTNPQNVKQNSMQSEMVSILSAKTEAERLKIAWGMWRSAQRMIRRIVESENPELSSIEQDKIVSTRMSHGT